ncbi:DUF3558 domain-containing protein [Nocardia camponoti]|uniref:DUF3558 domain-containing protein n=1 Tax=Nocardia camponoti TaxID=1616106 RepID=A0A917QAQ1_9NOCA|nr:DUF3558 domain-containing protein [Nocardia camponoti]GGK40345.1 hypothetical protein GCM10011591_10000 [Nocardia camponoti]
MKRSVLVLVACGLVAAGCGPEQGGSGGATTTAAAALFDPCTQISEDVLRAAGVDPASKVSGAGGVHQSGWEICSWDAPEYSLAVLSTGRSVAEFEAKGGNVDFQDVTIAGRKGRQFRVEGASKDRACDVVFPAQQGVLQLNVLDNPILYRSKLEDPCTVLARVGEVVVPGLPR